MSGLGPTSVRALSRLLGHCRRPCPHPSACVSPPCQSGHTFDRRQHRRQRSAYSLPALLLDLPAMENRQLTIGDRQSVKGDLHLHLLVCVCVSVQREESALGDRQSY